MGRWWCAAPPPACRSPPASSAESRGTENCQFSSRNSLELPSISLRRVVRLPSQVVGSPLKFHGDRDILLQQLLDALHFSSTFFDELLSVAGEIPQLRHRRLRDETSSKQAALEQLRQPGGAGDVGLTARDVLHVLGVDELQLDAGHVLKDVPDRLPVHARSLHGYLRHALGDQPVP